MGEIYSVTSQYMISDSGTSAERVWLDPKSAPGDQVARLKAVRVCQKGNPTDVVDIRYPINIEMEYWNFKPGVVLTCVFSLFNDQGTLLFVSPDFHEPEWGKKPKPTGLFRSCCVLPGNLLAEGRVSVVAEVSTAEPVYEIHFLEYDSVGFQVVDRDDPGSVRAGWGRNLPGVMRPWLDWKTELLEDRHGIL
jgi:lipopolysaccharide transport system ATP-binding protein